jgi:hypothetical protein
MVEYENVETSIAIVNEAGSTVYKGTKEDAADLLKTSDYCSVLAKKNIILS